MAEPPAKRFKAADCNDIIIVSVGREQKKYYLYPCDAKKTSDLFRNADTTGPPLNIPRFDPETFDIYVEWMYDRNSALIAAKDSYEHLMELYKLGEYLEDSAFRNMVMDTTIEIGVKPTWAKGNIEFQHLFLIASGAMHRLWIRVCAVSTKPTDVWVAGKGTLDDFFFRYLIEEYATMGGDPTKFRLPTMEDRCDYHDHDADEPRCT
ncbi:hypothetical protein BDY17DRAFT_324295 [Neohortaea acidophila]|uniref:BTB domain-containing protein n=1 Tax=Neohortaea acidophila TaxID=245834 RepID=A0A6A6PV23_9PEZI|nr:uncharacterized protein BDY17DRAFT_324295 [Neohortaea acidophila]KAF2483574.1 hypothetical protein BDY17DRAFT_324295 [Neohortaea acidophila]